MNADDLFNELMERPAFRAAWALDEPSLHLARNVSRLRTERGFTQAALADAAGVRQPRIAEIERGDANPTLSTITKIAVALGVSPNQLLAAPTHSREMISTRRVTVQLVLASSGDQPEAERWRVGAASRTTASDPNGLFALSA